METHDPYCRISNYRKPSSHVEFKLANNLQPTQKRLKDTAFNVGTCNVPGSIEVDANKLSLQTKSTSTSTVYTQGGSRKNGEVGHCELQKHPAKTLPKISLPYTNNFKKN